MSHEVEFSYGACLQRLVALHADDEDDVEHHADNVQLGAAESRARGAVPATGSGDDVGEVREQERGNVAERWLARALGVGAADKTSPGVTVVPLREGSTIVLLLLLETKKCSIVLLLLLLR